MILSFKGVNENVEKQILMWVLFNNFSKKDLLHLEYVYDINLLKNLFWTWYLLFNTDEKYKKI